MTAKTAFLTAITALFLYVMAPLALPVLMGGILAIIFHPWLSRLDRRGLDSRLGSALLTLGITVVLLVPVSVLIYLGAKSGLEQLQLLKVGARAAADPGAAGWIEGWLATPFVSRLLDIVGMVVPVDRSSLLDSAQDLLVSFGAKAADWLAQLFAKLPGAALDLLIIVVSVFFLLSDGPKLVTFLRRHSMFDARATDRVLDSMAGICRSVVLASVLSGATQAVLMLIACLIVGQKNPFLVGVLVFMGSFVPVVGAAPITFGLALYWLFALSTGSGVALLVAAVLVAGIDNVVRAAVLKGSANLHPLLAFTSAFGGLQAFGFMGIFLGPILASLFLTAVEVAGPSVRTG